MGVAASAVAAPVATPRVGETGVTAAAGSTGRVAAAAGSVVGEAPLSNGGGFFVAFSSGAVEVAGSAVWRGDMANRPLNKAIVGIASTPSGRGYWLVASDGGIFAFGDAGFYGSTGSIHLNRPIIGIASAPDGRGYWLVASDGGIFAFGDAGFYGSTGSIHLNRPIIGIASAPDGRGYWLVASDGGIFAFGDAGFYGSTGSIHLNQPIIGAASSVDGHGYWLVASDGGIFTFGDAPFKGSAVGTMSGGQAVGIVRSPSNGYWVLTSLGAVLPHGAPSMPSLKLTPFAAPTPAALPTPTPFAAPTPAAPPTPTPVAAPTPAALPAPVDPAVSVQPSVAFTQDCYSNVASAQCDEVALAAIDQARAGEGLGPLALPGNYAALSPDSQVLAVANAERTSRGLPSLAENPALDGLAQQGVVAGRDPQGPPLYGWGSNIAWGYATVLAADFGWMYDDGPGGDNIDCPTTVSSGCWGHRKNILAPWGGEAGAGFQNANGTTSYSELFVENYS